MERLTVMKTFNGRLSQQPIIDVMEPSLPYSSFAQKTNLRDASFRSSYLKPDEPPKAASQEHLGRIVDDSEISIFDAQKYFNEGHDQKENKRITPVNVNLERIAERCDLSAVPRLSSVSSADGYGRNYRARSFHATPTASSEASWNSQTGLLSNPPGSIAVSLRNLPSDEKKRGYSAKWFFGRKCPCTGKKSVQVEEKFSEPKTPVRFNNNSNGSLHPKRQNPKSVESVVENVANIKSETTLVVTRDWADRQEVIPNSQRFSPENHFPANVGHRVLASGRSFSDSTGFSFPILNQSSSTVKLVVNGFPPSNHLEDPPRDSLEVFQPLDESISRKSAEVERRILASHSADRERRSFTFPASPKSRMTVTDDDVASDASSDLFEIESFSTQTTSYPICHRRDSLDEASNFNARRLATNGNLYSRQSLDEPRTPSIAPTECYEPSEASIDWSVTTAEGFDRGSVTNFSITASEVDDVSIIQREWEKTGGGGGGGGGGWGGGSGGGGGGGGSRRKGNGLLSCRCEKAVSVGPHPVRFVPEGHRVGPPLPVSSTLRHVSSRPPIVYKPQLARSRSARLSLPFAT